MRDDVDKIPPSSTPTTSGTHYLCFGGDSPRRQRWLLPRYAGGLRYHTAQASGIASPCPHLPARQRQERPPLLCGSGANIQAQTLAAGDIAILGWNSIGESYPNQKWAFLAMRDITAGTVIIFTDNGYDASIGNFRTSTGNTSDGYLVYTVPSLIAKGTVVYGTNDKINGSTTGVSGQLGYPGPPSAFGFSVVGATR